MENTENPGTAETAISAPSYECTDWSLAWNTEKKEKYSYIDLNFKNLKNIHCFK